MHLLLFGLLIVGCGCNLQVSVDTKGEYRLSIDNRLWLRSSHTSIYVDDKWYSSDDKSLPLANITFAQGMDAILGNWNETQLIYDLVRNGTHTKVTGHIRQWTLISAITFYFDTGDQVLTNTKHLDMKEVRTVFSSFEIERIDEKDQRGYFTYAGEMAGNNDKRAGHWERVAKVVESGMLGGPVVLFDFNQKGEEDMLVLSPFSRFMATSFGQKSVRLEYDV